MIELSLFSQFIYPSLPEVSDMEFIANTRRACVEFCRKSLVWQFELDPIDIKAGKTEYAITLPSDSELSKVLIVNIDGERFEPLSENPPNDVRTFGYAPYYTVDVINKKITLVKSPLSDIPSGLKIKIALHPTFTAMQVPDILLTNYAESIAVGALGYLYSISGRPFSNFEMARSYKDDFTHAIDSATSDAAHGFSRAVLNTKESYI